MAAAAGSVVTAPDALARRLSQIGLVEAADGPRLQRELCPVSASSAARAISGAGTGSP
jgi:hypothetical protein